MSIDDQLEFWNQFYLAVHSLDVIEQLTDEEFFSAVKIITAEFNELRLIKQLGYLRALKVIR